MGVYIEQANFNLRRDTRVPVAFFVTAEHRHLGNLLLKVVDLSLTGVMVEGRSGLETGDQMILRLPFTNGVKILCLWTVHQRAGLQFDQRLGIREFTSIVNAMRSD